MVLSGGSDPPSPPYQRGVLPNELRERARCRNQTRASTVQKVCSVIELTGHIDVECHGAGWLNRTTVSALRGRCSTTELNQPIN